MLKIDCDICDSELSKPGALMFDPPYGELSACIKHHICQTCYRLLWDLLRKIKEPSKPEEKK